MNVVFFGSSHFVLPIIEFLNKKYILKLVITTEKNPTDAVPKYCAENNIPYVSVNSKQELLATSYQLQATKSPVAVLAYFGLIIPQSLIDIFPKGIVNIHPSLLPHYRGPTPGQTALVLGDTKTGVSIMLLDKDVDHGPVLAQKEEIISSTETSITLYDKLFKKGVDLLEAVLPAYLAGELKPLVQHHEKATFTKPLTRESGFIDVSKPVSPVLLDRMIRAYHPWPGVWARLRQGFSRQADISKLEGKIIKFLPNKMLQVEGKKPMSYKDFMNGYPEGKEFLEKLRLF